MIYLNEIDDKIYLQCKKMKIIDDLKIISSDVLIHILGEYMSTTCKICNDELSNLYICNICNDEFCKEHIIIRNLKMKTYTCVKCYDKNWKSLN